MDVTSKFPIYQADQVLSADHLNQSLAYLEKHDRLSRRLLHGTGIVCGLEFSVADGVLTITKGCGISSEGYLLAIEEDLALAQVRDYTPPYPPKYTPFYDGSDKPFKLWEAVIATEAEGQNLQPLSKLNLQNKVLMLYLEMYNKDLKDCVGDDCDNMGMVRQFTLRPLIISTQDLIKIFNQDGNTLEDVASDVLARYTLQDIIPPRFDVTPKNAVTAKSINDAYATLADTLMPEISLGMAQLELLFSDSLGMPKTMADAVKKLKEKLSVVRKKELGNQYFFDHLCDIAAAYNELVEVATKWLVTCMPAEDDFPRHLALGEFALIKEHMPKVFRHYFKHAAAAPEAHRQQKHVRFLYERLLKIIYNFELRSEKDVRTTRSNYNRILSEKAIPYYYRPADAGDQSWLLGWNYRQRERGAWKNVGHYFNNPQTQLLRDLENNNFFRIEGHLGQSYTEALSSIKKQINDYRLPVKAIALSTGSVPFDLSLLEECRTKDLDAQFESSLEALYCQMKEVSCFFGSIPWPGATQQKSVAGGSTTKESGAASLKESGMSFNVTSAKSSSFIGLRAEIDRISIVRGNQKTAFAKGEFIGSNCTLKDGTLGKVYFDAIQTDALKGKSLIDLYLPYLDLTERTPAVRQFYLMLIFAIIIIDEIEEMAGILDGAELSTLNFKGLSAFEEDLISFNRLYIAEINKLEREPEFDLHPLMHDIKHQLVHLMALCKMHVLFAIYKAYRKRLQTALAELQFSKFIDKHPGIDHKAGVTKGGTFILVYHSGSREREEVDLTPTGKFNFKEDRQTILTHVVKPKEADIKNAEAKEAAADSFARMRSAKPATMSKKDTSSRIKDEYLSFAKASGRAITPEFLGRLDSLLGEIDKREPEESGLPEGTVFADFYLPYVCCSDCGGIEINITEPVIPITISLNENRFCLGSEKLGTFTVSPAGGVVSGPGVEEKEGTFFFNPASADVVIGNATFVYTFEGRTAQTQASILAAPIAAFEAVSRTTANGSLVAFTNTSKNAKSFKWDFGDGKTSDAETPERHSYPADQEKATITLTAGNGVCEDVDVQTITLFTKEYSMRIGKERTEFCSNEQAQVIAISDGARLETFPFDGEVKGKGVVKATATNPVFGFNPNTAGVGTQKLEYVVDGATVASLEVTVKEAFVASFNVSVVSRSSDGMTVKVTNIQPDDKKSYNWRFNAQNPIAVVQHTDAKEFEFTYSEKDISNLKDVTIELQVNESPCVATHQEKVTIPPITRDTTNVVFDPNTTRVAFNTNTPLTVNMNTTRMVSFNTNTPLTQGQALLNEIAAAMDKPASLAKLTNGSMNTAIGKQFLEALTGIQDYANENRTKLTAAAKTQVLTLYAQVAVGMINYIGMLQSDLKSSEGLAKNFIAAGASMKAMVAIGMATAQKNEIKNRLTALARLNKPVAAELASKINKAL
jgi:PKD repeat protein